eukprot:11185286-Alexandrium_andersonii.AAC.1
MTKHSGVRSSASRYLLLMLLAVLVSLNVCCPGAVCVCSCCCAIVLWEVAVAFETRLRSCGPE